MLVTWGTVCVQAVQLSLQYWLMQFPNHKKLGFSGEKMSQNAKNNQDKKFTPLVYSYAESN